jgi:hypothetical protein
VLNPVLMVLHWLAALIVLLEAFNKLERCDPLQPGLHLRSRLVVWLKAIAWVLLALGAAGAVVRPALVASAQADPRIGSLLLVDAPSLVDFMYALGFAVLIVRSRLKEGWK